MSDKIARYGWLPDWPDQRDHFYAAPVELAGVLPAEVDIRLQCPPVYDQNQIDSCTANAIVGAIEFDRLKQKLAGFTFYESFESKSVARPGHASLPKSGERAIGGHAVAGVGYDDAPQWSIIRNSWGGKRGMKGYFTLPYAHVTGDNLASDFWTIRVVQ
jgi:C1A family cysteine protease